jgi:hypothetical protein
MITIVANFTRPSLDVPFFTMPSAYKNEFMTKYRYTGKSTSSTTTVADDGLSCAAATVWRTRLDFTEYLQDPLSETMRTARIAYCEANGIVVDVTATFTPSVDDLADTALPEDVINTKKGA